MLYIVDGTCYSRKTVMELERRLSAKRVSCEFWYAMSCTPVVGTSIRSQHTWLFAWDDSPFSGELFDSAMRMEQARDMSRAVMLDVCGSALVEAGCDQAQEEIAARFPGMYLTDRFSPGYGDLPLEIQPVICRLTDAQRRLGVHVTPSLLMNPQKSVTAIIGLADEPQRARIRGCAYCALREKCELRKGGRSCDD